ncbi:MAG: hypothetical protein PHQ98_04710 [Candidatus ainarchaeum sp.]|nr:hypothetical protein [Candidatus ainarchaeum sp.]
MKRIFLFLIIILLLSFSFALSDISFYPETPNITAFSTGFQKIYIFTDVDALEVTLSSSDFTVDEQTKQLENGFVVFSINGQTSGTKSFNLTFSNNQTESHQFDVSNEPMQVNGPFILTDFNFEKTYSSSQSIVFDCFGSTDIVVPCLTKGKYKIGSSDWVAFDLSSPITFDLNGENIITIQIENELGFTKEESFVLKINNPSYVAPVIPVATVTPAASSGGGGGGGSGSHAPMENVDSNKLDSNSSISIDSNKQIVSPNQTDLIKPVNEDTNISTQIQVKENIVPSLSSTAFFGLFDSNITPNELIIIVPVIVVLIIIFYFVFLKPKTKLKK